MKKKVLTKKAKPYLAEDNASVVSEPYTVMPSIKKLHNAFDNFPYSSFKKIVAKVPFTQSEWASILHLSERTLQRYSKDNKSFEGIYADRITHIEKLIDKGLETFSGAAAFYQWLHTPKNVLGTLLNFQSLSHTQGITDLYNQLERIQYGVYT